MQTLARGFDFTDGVRQICHHIAESVPELGHVDMSRVAVCFAQARIRSTWGRYASLTPMRFEGGRLETKRRGRTYRIQQLFDRSGREMLYILTFYLPRFQDQSFEEKLITIFHELWHISPAFDGDLRRHEGRCYAHTHSQAEYDAEMARLSQRWLADARPDDELIAFLRDDFEGLSGRYQAILGMKIPRPKLVPQS